MLRLAVLLILLAGFRSPTVSVAAQSTSFRTTVPAELVQDVSYNFYAADGFIVISTYVTKQLYVVDATTGEMKWQKTLDENGNCWLADRHLWCLAGDGLQLLDPDSGEEEWRVTVDEGAYVSYAVTDPTTAYVSISDGSIRAIDLAGGTESWRSSTADIAEGQPILLVVPGLVLAHVSGIDADAIVALDSATGDRLWVFADGHRLGDPQVVNGSIYVTEQDGIVNSISLITGVSQWSVATGFVDDPPEFTVIGNRLYVWQGHSVGSIDALSGASMSSGLIFDERITRVVGADQDIVYIDGSTSTFALRMSSSDPVAWASIPSDEHQTTFMTAAGLVEQTTTALIGLRPADGEVQWSVPAPQDQAIANAQYDPTNETIYLLGVGGALSAVPLQGLAGG
jgi:outer membrane protein assembly factor BamB